MIISFEINEVLANNATTICKITGENINDIAKTMFKNYFLRYCDEVDEKQIELIDVEVVPSEYEIKAALNEAEVNGTDYVTPNTVKGVYLGNATIFGEAYCRVLIDNHIMKVPSDRVRIATK